MFRIVPDVISCFELGIIINQIADIKTRAIDGLLTNY